LGQKSTALITVILVNFWRWIGFPILVFKAGLMGIPVEMNEAAIVDGANRAQIFRYVTLPLLIPTITMVTILTFIWDFNAFDLVFVMQGSSGNPHYATDLLATLFYRTAFGDSTTGGAAGEIGIASAIAVLMFIIIGVASYFGIKQMQKKEVVY
jgi:raffinose/stachyose/melibiose transport system permease protein